MRNLGKEVLFLEMLSYIDFGLCGTHMDRGPQRKNSRHQRVKGCSQRDLVHLQCRTYGMPLHTQIVPISVSHWLHTIIIYHYYTLVSNKM